MALNLATLLPAKINTSEIATKYDVSSSIAAYNPATYINTNTTTIDGGKISTGTITAGQIAANTIATSNLSTNIGLVNGYVYSSNFNGNVSGDIGMPTAGFRLSSNAAGTSADPTIYGAYIKGGTVDATAIAYESAKIRSTTIATNFGLPYAESTSHNATGSVQIVYAYSDYFYGPSYGAGFLERRVCSNSQKIYIKGTANAQSAGTSQFCYSSLEYSINDGTWTALVTDSYFGSSAVFSISLDSSTVRFRHKADSVTVKTGVFSQITVTTVAGA